MRKNMVNKLEQIIFSESAFTNFCTWMRQNPILFDKIDKLINDCLRHPFNGLGKPEPLKGAFKGCWSRRINNEHRLIYFVTEQGVHVIACKSHYDF